MRRLRLSNSQENMSQLSHIHKDKQDSQNHHPWIKPTRNNNNEGKADQVQQKVDARALIMQLFEDQSNQNVENKSSYTVSLAPNIKEEENILKQKDPKIEERSYEVSYKKEENIEVNFSASFKIKQQQKIEPSKQSNLSNTLSFKSGRRTKNNQMERPNPLKPFIIKKSLIQNQKEVEIGKKNVYFPYQPYKVQIDYMNKVFQALDGHSNALLESPTGTGKTLCLLSSVLTWVEDHYRRTGIKTKVIYMSRTHSQLQQVHKELQKTCFRPNMAIFASRDQLCIKQELNIMKGKEKIEACGRGIKLAKKIKRQTERGKTDFDRKILQNACKYHKQSKEVMAIAEKRLSNTLIDIPVMRQIGQQQQFCPYFYPLNTKQINTLFLMPYNYLLDAYLISVYEQMLTDSIIIFDEAHNVAEASCEGRSLTIESSNIEGAILQMNGIVYSPKASQSLKELRDNYYDELDFVFRKLEQFKAFFTQFGQRYLNFNDNIFNKSSQYQEDAQVKYFQRPRTDEKIFQMFCGRPIPDHKLSQFQKKEQFYKNQLKLRLICPLNQIVQYGANIIEVVKQLHDASYRNLEKIVAFSAKINQLLKSFLFSEKKDWKQIQLNHFRLHISRASDKDKSDSFTFGLRCLVPWLTFEGIQKKNPRSIILTSGTMKPLDTWEKQLQLKFERKLTNAHVIDEEQIKTKVISSGPGPKDIPFNFSFDSVSRNKDIIYKELLDTIIDISSVVPNGILLVFPSFRVQKQFRDELLKSKRRFQLQQKKYVMFEQKHRNTDLTTFTQRALGPKGAIMGMICRGRLSEGIDFPDGLCRAVIMVSIPYANPREPFIAMKKEHLNSIYDSSSLDQRKNVIRGNDWYFMGAIRAINQAIGRVIRHAKDYGMIFFIDTRYQESSVKKQLPGWVTESMRSVAKPNHSFYQEIKQFYEKMEVKYGFNVMEEPIKQVETKPDSQYIGNKKENIQKNRFNFQGYLKKKEEKDKQSSLMAQIVQTNLERTQSRPPGTNSFKLMMCNRHKFKKEGKKGSSDLF